MPIDLKAMRERCEKATKGPWKADTMQPFDCVVWAKNGDSVAQIGQRMAPCTTWEELMTMQNAGEARLIAEAEKADAEFIANAKSDMEQLLDAVEELNLKYRYRLWLAYPGTYKYADDGEMQCGRIDFKRDPLSELEAELDRALIEKFAVEHATQKESQ